MSTFSQADAFWMAKALKIAEGGRFSTMPNPNVGCVIVSADGNMLGQGYHQRAGEAHAEVNALIHAGFTPQDIAKSQTLEAGHTSSARLPTAGATAYVTLEPCSHVGKTPPCALALINAQVARVVIASADENPLVQNKGIQLLKGAGIQVDTGLMAQQARDLNAGFNHRMTTKLPWVTVKLATSLDGKTALANGKSQWITSLQARANVQIERAKSCAILSGADTVIADNPRLSVRVNELPLAEKAQFLLRKAQPLRVIIDGQNRLHDDYQIFKDGHAVLVFNAQHNTRLNSVNTEQCQVPVAPAPIAHCDAQHVATNKSQDPRSYLDLQAIMQELGRREINRIWTEAGPSLCGALFKARLVNELILYQAPMLLGTEAKGTVDIGCLEHLEEAIKSKFEEVTKVGNDLKLRLLIKS